MKHLTPHRTFSNPHQMLVRLFNCMTGSFTQYALLISQSGSASSRLNVSSPPKGRGFHVRFSESVSKVKQGSDLVNESSETFNEIVTGVKKVSNLMTEIVAASKEQTAGIEEVNQAISRMDQITQKNTSMVEETSATSEQMVEKVQILSGLSHQFKMDNH